MATCSWVSTCRYAVTSSFSVLLSICHYYGPYCVYINCLSVCFSVPCHWIHHFFSPLSSILCFIKCSYSIIILLVITLIINHNHFYFISHRLQDSLEFIGQDSNTLRPDQNTGPNSLLGNIGNHGDTVTYQTFFIHHLQSSCFLLVYLWIEK